MSRNRLMFVSTCVHLLSTTKWTPTIIFNLWCFSAEDIGEFDHLHYTKLVHIKDYFIYSNSMHWYNIINIDNKIIHIYSVKLYKKFWQNFIRIKRWEEITCKVCSVLTRFDSLRYCCINRITLKNNQIHYTIYNFYF